MTFCSFGIQLCYCDDYAELIIRAGGLKCSVQHWAVPLHIMKCMCTWMEEI